MQQRISYTPQPPRSSACAWRVHLLIGRKREHNTSQASVRLILLRWRSWRPWVAAGCASLITRQRRTREIVYWQRLSGSVFWHVLVTPQQPMNRPFEPLIGGLVMRRISSMPCRHWIIDHQEYLEPC